MALLDSAMGGSGFRVEVQRQIGELTQSWGLIGHMSGWEAGQGPTEWTVLKRAVRDSAMEHQLGGEDCGQ